jgi:hypothetical protein
LPTSNLHASARAATTNEKYTFGNRLIEHWFAVEQADRPSGKISE